MIIIMLCEMHHVPIFFKVDYLILTNIGYLQIASKFKKLINFYRQSFTRLLSTA